MKVRLVESSYDADFLIYKVDSEYDADILVYKLDSEYDAEKGPEYWFFSSDPYDEKAKKIFYAESQYDAKLLVYYVQSDYDCKVITEDVNKLALLAE
eukprot:gene10386-2915_t